MTSEVFQSTCGRSRNHDPLLQLGTASRFLPAIESQRFLPEDIASVRLIARRPLAQYQSPAYTLPTPEPSHLTPCTISPVCRRPYDT